MLVVVSEIHQMFLLLKLYICESARHCEQERKLPSVPVWIGIHQKSDVTAYMLVAGARTRMFFALKIFKLDGCENVRRDGQDRKLPLTLV